MEMKCAREVCTPVCDEGDEAVLVGVT